MIKININKSLSFISYAALCITYSGGITSREEALAAVRRDPRLFRHLPDNFRGDGEIALAAARHIYHYMLEFASDELKAGIFFAMTVVSRCGHDLQFFHPNVKANRDVVLAAVQRHGQALYYADSVLKRDRDVVLAAIMQDSHAFIDADPSFRSDKAIALVAVTQNGEELGHVDATLKADRDVILAALTQNSEAFKHADMNTLLQEHTSLSTCVQCVPIFALLTPEQMNIVRDLPQWPVFLSTLKRKIHIKLRLFPESIPEELMIAEVASFL